MNLRKQDIGRELRRPASHVGAERFDGQRHLLCLRGIALVQGLPGKLHHLEGFRGSRCLASAEIARAAHFVPFPTRRNRRWIGRSRVALFDRNGKWLKEWGKRGSGEGEFRNPHGLVFVPGSTDVIVADRETPGTAELFRRSPTLVAFTRCAVDIRNVDLQAASEEGILVTRAGPGFIASVAEWVIGAMIDLSRGITDATAAYRAGRTLAPTLGRELKHSTLGVIGYGHIGRYLCDLALAFGTQVVVSDPQATVSDQRLRQTDLATLLAESDFVVCLAPATAETASWPTAMGRR